MDAYEDSLEKRGIREKYHRLDEVVVKAKKWNHEKEIYENRSKSIAYYDVPAEIDEIHDRGDFIGNDIHELLLRMNERFVRRVGNGEEWLKYKGRSPLFVVDYRRTEATEADQSYYKTLDLETIKSIYINEELPIRCRYADPRMTSTDVDR